MNSVRFVSGVLNGVSSSDREWILARLTPIAAARIRDEQRSFRGEISLADARQLSADRLRSAQLPQPAQETQADLVSGSDSERVAEIERLPASQVQQVLADVPPQLRDAFVCSRDWSWRGELRKRASSSKANPQSEAVVRFAPHVQRALEAALLHAVKRNDPTASARSVHQTVNG